MTILVSDISVLVDLERGGLLEAAFSCDLTIIVTDLLFQRELAKVNGPYLCSLGLGIVALTAQELLIAQTIKSQRKSLSLPDCFALAYAQRQAHCLVTGDKTLRSEALKHLGTVYDLLWILDRMVESGSVPKQQLRDGLAVISNYHKSYIPKDEMKARLVGWAN